MFAEVASYLLCQLLQTVATVSCDYGQFFHYSLSDLVAAWKVTDSIPCVSNDQQSLCNGGVYYTASWLAYSIFVTK